MLQNQVVIAGQSVSKIEYKGQPVITFKMIDEVHQRPEGTAKRNFIQNKDRFILNEDYFEVPFEVWSKIFSEEFRTSEKSKNHNKMIFLTQSGYLMIVKSLNDDLAWQVQRELVNRYFKAKELSYDSIDKRLSKIEKMLNAKLEKERYLEISMVSYEEKDKPIDFSKIKFYVWYPIRDFYKKSKVNMTKNMFGRRIKDFCKKNNLFLTKKNIRNVKHFMIGRY